MPPAMRTLLSGRRVAVCPERGSSIGVAAVTVPTRDTAGAVARNAAAATAKLIVKLRVVQATNNRRDRVMPSSLRNKTYSRVNGKRSSFVVCSQRKLHGQVICAVAETCFVVIDICDKGTLGSTGATVQIVYVPAGARVWHCASPVLLTDIRERGRRVGPGLVGPPHGVDCRSLARTHKRPNRGELNLR